MPTMIPKHWSFVAVIIVALGTIMLNVPMILVGVILAGLSMYMQRKVGS